MPTPALPMTPPPVAPDRSDRATFAARATASFDHLKAHATPEIAAAMANVYGNAVEAVNAASAAGSSASTATTKADQAAADRVQTGLDRVATAADRTQTGLDRASASADRTQTGLDRAAAAASAAAASAVTGIPSISGKALKVLTVNAGATAMEWAAPATVTLTGEVTTVGSAATVANAAVIGKVLTGFSAGAGTVAASDTILAAINKLVGNVALKAPSLSPTFTTPNLGVATGTSFNLITGLSSATPSANGAAAAGTATTAARGDHTHPSDTTRASLAANTFAGLQKFGAAVQETKVAMSASNIDLATGNYFTKTIAAATTLTLSNIPASGTVFSFLLELTNGGAFAVTLPTGSKPVGGTAITLTISGKDVLGCFSHDGGATLNWVVAKDFK